MAAVTLGLDLNWGEGHGHGSVETAVQATKLGAYDYLEKPLDLEKVPILVRNAMRESAASEK